MSELKKIYGISIKEKDVEFEGNPLTYGIYRGALRYGEGESFRLGLETVDYSQIINYCIIRCFKDWNIKVKDEHIQDMPELEKYRGQIIPCTMKTLDIIDNKQYMPLFRRFDSEFLGKLNAGHVKN